MRRPIPQIPVSPVLLKRFAIVTVAVTGLIALFANGEATQMQAEVQAREAKNDLINTEADKLGTRKVAMGMTVKAQAGGWGGDDGGSGGDGSGGDGSIDPNAPGPGRAIGHASGFRPQMPMIPRNLPMTPGATVTVKNQLATDLSGPVGDAARAKQKSKNGTMFKPSEQQIQEIKAKSRERSGGTSQEDF